MLRGMVKAMKKAIFYILSVLIISLTFLTACNKNDNKQINTNIMEEVNNTTPPNENYKKENFESDKNATEVYKEYSMSYDTSIIEKENGIYLQKDKFEKLLFKNIHEADVKNINDVQNFYFNQKIDSNRFIFSKGAYEGLYGVGIYDIRTDETKFFDGLCYLDIVGSKIIMANEDYPLGDYSNSNTKDNAYIYVYDFIEKQMYNTEIMCRSCSIYISSDKRRIMISQDDKKILYAYDIDTFEEIEPYSTDELVNMLLNYLELNNGEKVQISTSIEGEEVTIHLFDDMGTHIATRDWYTINKYTACGTTLLGDEFDLTEINIFATSEKLDTQKVAIKKYIEKIYPLSAEGGNSFPIFNEIADADKEWIWSTAIKEVKLDNKASYPEEINKAAHKLYGESIGNFTGNCEEYNIFMNDDNTYEWRGDYASVYIKNKYNIKSIEKGEDVFKVRIVEYECYEEGEFCEIRNGCIKVLTIKGNDINGEYNIISSHYEKKL